MIEFETGRIMEFVQVLGWTLLHFVWQGILLGVVFALLRRLAVNAAPAVRYWIGLVTLIALAVCPLITFGVLYENTAATTTVAAAIAPVAAVVNATEPVSGWAVAVSWLDGALPWAVLAWVVGVCALAGRLASDWYNVKRLVVTGTRRLTGDWEAKVLRLKVAYGIRRHVTVLESVRISVPMVIGWLKPVILLPPAAFVGLTPRQLEMIISHELAHVKRLDYLVNLLQLLVETLLFYHPVVRWVSNEVRREREHCCDDAVIDAAGDRLTYAKALAGMEELRCSMPRVSVAATGGNLVGRIKRIVAMPAPQHGAVHWLLGVALLATSAATVTGTQYALDNETPFQVEQPAVTEVAAAVTGETAASPVAAADPLPAPEPAPPVVEATPPRVIADVPRERASVKPREPVSETPAAKIAPATVPATVATVTPPPEDAEPAAIKVEPVPETPAPVETPVSPSERLPEPAPTAEPSEPEYTGGQIVEYRQPKYPRRARIKGVEGWVTVQYTVNEDGTPSDVAVVESSPSRIFDRPVVKAVSKWRFEPYRLDGQVVSRTVAQTIHFGTAPDETLAVAEGACATLTGSRLCKGLIEDSPDPRTEQGRSRTASK